MVINTFLRFSATKQWKICKWTPKKLVPLIIIAFLQFFQNFYILESLHVSIVIRNRKIVWKHRPYCWCFPLNLKYPGLLYKAYIKTTKNGDFHEELLSENDIEAVLATLCCYDHGAKASGAVQKIATDQKEYCKCSLCVIICWIAKIYL